MSDVQPGGPGLEVTETTATTTTATTPTTTTATTPATATTAPTTTATATTPPPTTTTEIGAGGGEEARIPADFTIGGGGVTPGTIEVPAFLTIALRASSGDGRAHTLRITTPKGAITLAVPAGGAATKDVDGLPAGRYLVAVDGQPTDGALVVGGEPGP